MSTRKASEEFVYNNEKIIAIITTNSEHMAENRHYLQFDYAGIRVNEVYDDSVSGYYYIGQKLCEMIDTIGVSMYQEYTAKKEEIREIQRNRVIINQNVYGKYVHNETPLGGNKYIHQMAMGMADGNSVDGSPKSKFFYDDEIRSKNKTFENMKSRILEYHKINNILPAEKYLNPELTLKYNEIYNWFKENIPDQYYKQLF